MAVEATKVKVTPAFDGFSTSMSLEGQLNRFQAVLTVRRAT
jgi:hypothetical protein